MPIINTQIKGSAAPVIETLNVSPSTSAQQITAPQGTDGYSPVNVSAVTAGIDANIQAGNIKDGVTILGVTGNYQGGITPSGTINITTNGTHNVTNYASAEVQVPSTAPEYYIPLTTSGGQMLKGTITQIPSGGSATTIGQRVLYYAWYYNNVGTTQNVDWSGITAIQDYGCAYALAYCSVVGSVDLSNLTFINSTGLQQAFAYSSITSLDLSNLEYLSSGNAMGTACRGCASLTSVNFNKLKAISGSNALSSTFRDCTALTSISFPALETITVSLSNTFTGCSSLTNVSFPALKTVNGGGTSVFSSTFSNCTSLTTFAFGSSEMTVSGNNAFSNTFSGCTNLTTLDLTSIYEFLGGTSSQPTMNNLCPNCPNLTTVKFGRLYRAELYSLYRTFANVSSLRTVTFDYPLGSSNTHLYSGTRLYRTFEYSGISNIPVGTFAEHMNSSAFGMTSTFQYCDNLTSVDMSNIKSITAGDSMLSQIFANCSNLASVDLSGLELLSGYKVFLSTFQNCTSLVGDFSFAKLVQIGNNLTTNTSCMFQSAFSGCSGLTSFSLPSLSTLCGSALVWGFSAPNVTNIYFGALRNFLSSANNTQISGVAGSTTGCTLHFPKNLDPTSASPVFDITTLDGYPAFGGTNTILAFDLPSAYILTGANTSEYERSPKDDTQSALAWRIKDTGLGTSRVIDWTPYYTSGTADPVVGDTIYSDSACTTAVTTISSIA